MSNNKYLNCVSNLKQNGVYQEKKKGPHHRETVVIPTREEVDNMFKKIFGYEPVIARREK